MSDADLDDMIAEADPKSREALAQQQQTAVQQQAQVAAKRGNTVRNVLLGLAVIGGAYYLVKKADD